MERFVYFKFSCGLIIIGKSKPRQLKMRFYNFVYMPFLCALLIVAVISLQTGAAQIRIRRDNGHGITGPVHTFVKTDKHANFKWGVRHHVGKHYAGH